MNNARVQTGKFKVALKSLGLVILFLILCWSLIQNVKSLVRGRQELQEIDEKVKIEAQKNEDLTNKLKELQTDFSQEKAVRDKLGLVKDGEISVVLPPKDEVRKAAPVQNQEKASSDIPNWKQWINLFLN